MPGAQSRERLGGPPGGHASVHGRRCDRASRDPVLWCTHPSRPFPQARRDRYMASAAQTCAVLPSSAPYSPPRALSVPDPVSTMDELSVARLGDTQRAAQCFRSVTGLAAAGVDPCHPVILTARCDEAERRTAV